MSTVNPRKNRMELQAGTVFSKLTYVAETGTFKGERYALWQCACGVRREIRIKSVIGFNQKSCGCGRRREEYCEQPKETSTCTDCQQEKTVETLPYCRECAYKRKLVTTNDIWGLIASPFDFSLAELYR